MKKYLFALDLDGTLLYDWETISKDTKNYLIDIQEQGHQIVIATGRPFRSSQPFHKELGLQTPIINYNGGLVTSVHDESFEPFSVTVKKEDILDIYNNNLEHIDNCFGEIYDDIFLHKDTEEIAPLLHNFNGARLFTGDLNTTLTGDVNGFIIIGKKGEAEIIEQYIEDRFKGSVLCRNWGEHYAFVLEVYSPLTNKGNGLEYVSKHLNIPRENIVAFGDAHNDIEMLQYAELGVAMQNAQDRLKVHADDITPFSNTEDGLIKYIQSFLNNQK